VLSGRCRTRDLARTPVAPQRRPNELGSADDHLVRRQRLMQVVARLCTAVHFPKSGGDGFLVPGVKPSNFDRKSSKFDRKSSKFDRKSSKFDRKSSNFDHSITEMIEIHRFHQNIVHPNWKSSKFGHSIVENHQNPVIL